MSDVLDRLMRDHQQFADRGEPSLFGDAAEEIRHLRARLAEVATDLYRNHDMPPRKDSRSYSYRNGWWDGVRHAARVVERAASENSTPPATRVHNHPPYRANCNERTVDDQLRGACLNDDGSDR